MEEGEEREEHQQKLPFHDEAPTTATRIPRGMEKLLHTHPCVMTERRVDAV
jgi:hypothetical protein